MYSSKFHIFTSTKRSSVIAGIKQKESSNPEISLETQVETHELETPNRGPGKNVSLIINYIGVIVIFTISINQIWI